MSSSDVLIWYMPTYEVCVRETEVSHLHSISCSSYGHILYVEFTDISPGLSSILERAVKPPKSAEGHSHDLVSRAVILQLTPPRA